MVCAKKIVQDKWVILDPKMVHPHKSFKKNCAVKRCLLILELKPFRS